MIDIACMTACDIRLARTVSKLAKPIPVSLLRKMFAQCFECVAAKRYIHHTVQAISINPYRSLGFTHHTE